MDKPEDVEVLWRETAFRGYLRVERLRLRHRLYAGGMGGELAREVIQRGDAVAVLPYDPVRDQVVLIEQFRVGPYVRGDAPWQIEIVAGIVEGDEASAAVAYREAREEAGLDLAELTHVLDYYSSPGVMSEHIAVFVARIDASGAGGVHGLDEEGEDIRVLTLGFDEAIAALAAGRIKASPAVIALQWLALNRDALRQRWKAGT